MDVDEVATGRPSRVKRPPERLNVVALAQAFDELEESERDVPRRASTSEPVPAGSAGEIDDEDERERTALEFSEPDEDSQAEDAYVDSDEEAAKVEQAAAAKLAAMQAAQLPPVRVDKGKGRAVEPDLAEHLVEYEVRARIIVPSALSHSACARATSHLMRADDAG